MRLVSVVKGAVPRSLRPLLRRLVTSTAGRLGQPAIAHGALTQYVLKTYCRQRGAEIGPAATPYGRRGDTVMVDRFERRHARRSVVDVLADGRQLPFASAALDHLIASHVLEHQPDVLSTLAEWRRVLRPGGALVLVLPHLERTFDRDRTASDVAHHRGELGAPEHVFVDEAHWAEIERSLRERHYWMSDPRAKRPDGSWNRDWIVANQFVHYHAWTQHEMVGIVAAAGFRVVAAVETVPERRDSFLLVARRDGVNRRPADV